MKAPRFYTVNMDLPSPTYQVWDRATGRMVGRRSFTSLRLARDFAARMNAKIRS